MNRQQRTSTFPAALGYGVLVVLFFAPHLLRLAAFPDGDFTQHFLPFSLFQQDALLNFRLPVWDQYTNSGHPFLADAQSAVFYPISNALLLLTGFERSPSGRLFWLQVEAALHLFLACVFTYHLVRRLTGQRKAAFAAGLIFGFSGYLTGYPPLQLGVLRTAIWLPLILLLLLPANSGAFRWRRWLMAAAVHAVAFFAGHPQTFLFLSYAVGGWMLMQLGVIVGQFTVFKRRREGTDSRERGTGGLFDASRVLLFGGQLAVYIVTLIVLTLGQLWPAWEFTQLSVRSSLPIKVLSGGFPLEDSWQLLLPGILTEYSPQYIGVAALGLVLIAVAALLSSGFSLPGADPSARPAAFFFVICGGVALLLSYGANGPLYWLFYRFAPGGNLFRGQERAIYLVAFSLSVLSGYGLALLPTLGARLRRNLGWAFLAAVGVGAALFFMQFSAREDISQSAFLLLGAKAILLSAAFALLCGVRVGPGGGAPSQGVCRTHLLLFFPLLLADLFIFNFSTNLANGPAIRAALARPEAAITLLSAQDLAAESDGLPPRVYNEFRLPESSGMFVGWEDVYGSSPLRLAKYDTLFQEFPLGRMWELTGVGSVLTWRRELFSESQVEAEFPGETDTTFLHRLNAASPRLWWTQKARRAPDKTVLALLADESFNIQSELLIAPSDAEQLGEGWIDDRLTFGSGGTASLHVAREGPAHLIIGIESAQPGLLFVSENWMPGWQATWRPNGGSSSNAAAGQPARTELPVVRANQAFLGVPVPAGAGTLELAYRPNSVRWGLAISAIGWAAWLFALRGALWGMLSLAVQQSWQRVRAVVREWLRATSFSEDSEKQAGHVTPTHSQEEVQFSWPSLLASGQIHRAGMLLILLVGFALRLFRLDFQELRGDEAFGYFFSLHSFARILEDTLTLREPHPVGSYFLQHAWYGIAGTSEFALRALTALAGTAAIPLVYRMARQLRLGGTVALTSSFLMAVSAYAVWHSQDARMYTLSLALTSASTVLALQIIGQPRVRYWAGYVLCAVVAMHTHYFAAFVLLAQNLYVLFLLFRDLSIRNGARRGGEGGSEGVPEGEKSDGPVASGGGSRFSLLTNHASTGLLVRWAGAQIAIFLLLAPWLANAWQTLVGYHGNGDSPEFGAMLWRSLGVFALGESVPHHIWQFDSGVLAAVLIAAGILSGLHSARGRITRLAGGQTDRLQQQSREKLSQTVFRGHTPSVLLLLYLFVPLLATWISSLERPIFNERYLIAGLTPFLLLLTMGVAGIGNRVEDWLGWRWRSWSADADPADAAAADAGKEALPVGSPTLLAKIPVGQVAATALIVVILAGNLFSLHNYYFDPAFSKIRGWRELAATLERWSDGLTSAEVRFSENFPDPTLWYYYKGEIEHTILPPGPHDVEGSAIRVQELRESGVQRVILPVQLAPNWDPTGIAQEALASAYRLTVQDTVGVWPLQLYSLPNPQRWRLLDVAFLNGLTLTRAQVGPETVQAGGIQVIHMDWSGDPTSLSGGEKIFLHLLDESGNLVAQTDPELRMDSSTASFSVGLHVPSTLPPGSLRLMAGLYDITLEGAPKILTDSGDDSFLLAYFEYVACDSCMK